MRQDQGRKERAPRGTAVARLQITWCSLTAARNAVAIEQVDLHGSRALPLERLTLPGGSARRGHLMPSLDQQRHNAAALGTGSPGYEYPHWYGEYTG